MDRVPCDILDVSLSGALLAVATVLGIPDRAVLRLPNGQQVLVEIVRRNRGKLGVKYVRAGTD